LQHIVYWIAAVALLLRNDEKRIMQRSQNTKKNNIKETHGGHADRALLISQNSKT